MINESRHLNSQFQMIPHARSTCSQIRFRDNMLTAENLITTDEMRGY